MSYWNKYHVGAKVKFELGKGEIHPRWDSDVDYGGSGKYATGYIFCIREDVLKMAYGDRNKFCRCYSVHEIKKRQGSYGYPVLIYVDLGFPKPKRTFYVQLEKDLKCKKSTLPKGFVSRACKAHWLNDFTTISLLDVNPDPNKNPINAFQVSTLECFEISKTTYYSKLKGQEKVNG